MANDIDQRDREMIGPDRTQLFVGACSQFREQIRKIALHIDPSCVRQELLADDA